MPGVRDPSATAGSTLCFWVPRARRTLYPNTHATRAFWAGGRGTSNAKPLRHVLGSAWAAPVIAQSGLCPLERGLENGVACISTLARARVGRGLHTGGHCRGTQLSREGWEPCLLRLALSDSASSGSSRSFQKLPCLSHVFWRAVQTARQGRGRTWQGGGLAAHVPLGSFLLRLLLGDGPFASVCEMLRKTGVDFSLFVRIFHSH